MNLRGENNPQPIEKRTLSKGLVVFIDLYMNLNFIDKPLTPLYYGTVKLRLSRALLISKLLKGEIK